jgi:plasmid stability protein
MRTLTIRKIPEAVFARIKAVASLKNHSMEQEVRALLERKYASTPDITTRIRERWKELPETTPAQIKTWRKIGQS